MKHDVERLAHHEAGHAVACYLVRLPFSQVSIVADPSKNSLGHVTPQFWPGFRAQMEFGGLKEAQIKNRVERAVTALLAGQEAEMHFDPKSKAEGAYSDFERAFDLAERQYADVAQAYIDWMLAYTRQMIRFAPNWNAIEQLAQVLIESHAFGSRRARQVIAQAIRGTWSTGDQGA